MKFNKNTLREIFKRLNSKEKSVSYLQQNILAWNPQKTYIYKRGEKMDFLKSFQGFIKKYSSKKYKIIGFVSYDLGYQLHNIKQTAIDDLRLPDIYFHAYDKWIEFKNGKVKTRNISPKEIEEILKRPIQKSSKNISTNFQPEISKTTYNKNYKKIQHYIREGEFYQINYTHRFKAKTSLSSRELFLKIVQSNPVEFLNYIEGPNFEILSASPERFVKIKNRKIETCPIKGTRPRGKNLKEDQKFKKELLESSKEAAELNMITDLLRNDLGKVCEIGSVKVIDKRMIKKCPTVWHTFSRIVGIISKKYSPIEALISMLPGGSITGCPKKRTMEIIDQLEPNTRSVYTGVIGSIDNDALDFSIAIRTIMKKGQNLYLQVGGGIVIDSENKAEYDETFAKAASFMKILC